MNNSFDLPLWTKPTQLENWPTQLIQNEDLAYQLPIKQGWYSIPEVQETPFTVTHIYQGQQRGEWLLVDFMHTVDPSHNLRNWVDQFIPMIGFPSQFIKEIEFPSPKLLEWTYEGSPHTLADRLQVDEIHLYQGLASLSDTHTDLIRLYIGAARKQQRAWKFTLSFQSACLPGMTDEQVYANDHIRAGATFGFINLR